MEIADDDFMLHYNKPLYRQPEIVKKAIDDIVTWDLKDNIYKSNFSDKYNIEKAEDGFKFARPVDGKIKYKTLAEAYAAAEKEIKRTFTGRMFYDHLANNKNHDYDAKKASLLLDSLGVRGNKYTDKGTYNYVIYGDSNIEIIRTYYQDDEFIAFLNDYPGIVKEAAGFESAEDLAGYYSAFGEMSEETLQRAKDAGYFDEIYKAAKEGRDPAAADNQEGTIPKYDFYKNVSAKRIVNALRAYGLNYKQVQEASRLARRNMEDDGKAVSYLESLGVSGIDAEAFAEHAKTFTHSEYLWLEREAANEKPVKLGAEPTEAVKKFYTTLHENSKEIHPDNDFAKMEAEIAGEGRTSDDFIAWINTEKGFNDFIETAAATQREGYVRGETESETKMNEAAVKAARTAFNLNNPNWKAAFDNANSKKQIPEKTKAIIRGMIRNRPLQYMEAYAVMSRDDTWLPNENDVQRIKRLDTSGLVDEDYLSNQNPEELQRIGQRLASDRIRKKIDNGTLRWDDPDLTEYEQILKTEQSERQREINRKKEEMGEYHVYLERALENEKRYQILVRELGRNKTDQGIT